MPDIIRKTWVYANLTNDEISAIASELAYVMDGYADYMKLTDETDSFYDAMKERYDEHVNYLQSERGLDLDWLADNVLCPEW